MKKDRFEYNIEIDGINIKLEAKAKAKNEEMASKIAFEWLRFFDKEKSDKMIKEIKIV